MLIISSCVLLVACASVEPPPASSAHNSVATDPVYIDRFTLTGRLSVRTGDRLDTVHIKWSRVALGDTMRIFSPFGNQLALVTSTAGGANLQRGDVVERADTVEALTLSLLGVSIAPHMLARWIQGLDLSVVDRLPNSGTEPADHWTIQAENLRQIDGVIGGRVAGRVLARAGEVSLRLVIDSFEPRSSTSRDVAEQ